MSNLRKSFLYLALAAVLLLGFGSGRSFAGAEPNPAVIMDTSMGRIIIMLYPDSAPITVKNFLRYVDEGFYNGTIFHRIVKMEIDKHSDANKKKQQAINIVQGGGYNFPLERKMPLWDFIPLETGLENTKGTIAMARGGSPNTAQCEFFFNAEDNPGLDTMTVTRHMTDVLKDTSRNRQTNTIRAGYCAFGKVIRGMDVVEKMLDVKTERVGQHLNVPTKPIFIKKIYRAR